VQNWCNADLTTASFVQRAAAKDFQAAREWTATIADPQLRAGGETMIKHREQIEQQRAQRNQSTNQPNSTSGIPSVTGGVFDNQTVVLGGLDRE
jgi:hypothetical protein